jgi:spore maturation protein CgeB
MMLPTDRPLRIVYAGSLKFGGTCLHRMRAIQHLGHRTYGIDSTEPQLPYLGLVGRVMSKAVVSPRHWSQVSQTIIDVCRSVTPDVLWVDKGLGIDHAVLSAIREARNRPYMVHYCPDDYQHPAFQRYGLLDSLVHYDVVITTKSFNVEPLRRHTSAEIVYCNSPFDEWAHGRQVFSYSPSTPVGFVGSYERRRAQSIIKLANHGIPVVVYGTGPWRRVSHPRITLNCREVNDDEYVDTLKRFEIALCFLREESRDLHTTRSLEIPATGSFMLAEASAEHREMFRDGIEAVLFDSDDDLVRKAKYYLSRPDIRRDVARAGYEKVRLLKSGNLDVVERILGPGHRNMPVTASIE